MGSLKNMIIAFLVGIASIKHKSSAQYGNLTAKLIQWDINSGAVEKRGALWYTFYKHLLIMYKLKYLK